LVFSAVTAGILCGYLSFNVSAAPPELTKRTINIRERVDIESTDIRLKDLVINKGILDDSELEYEIITLGSKNRKTLSLLDLAYIMKNYSSLLNVKLRGPSYIFIKKKESNAHIERARNEIINYVRNTAPWKDWTVTVLFNSNDEQIIGRVGEFDKLKVNSFNSGARMLGSIAFNIDFFESDGAKKDSVTITPVIQRRIDVVVAANTLQRGTRIKHSDIKIVPMWVDGNSKNYINSPKDCLGKELAKKLNSGEFIRHSDVLMPVCAKRGDIIWVQCNAGTLMVRVAATVLEDGRKNDFVRVRNNSSNKVIEVKLIEEKLAVKNI
jgi:flagella basal body P-ring formation protein FlgA